MTLYKWLDGNQACNGGTGRWQKNRWRSVTGDLIPCEHGLHLCRVQDLSRWVGPTLWLAEHDGELIEQDDKVVVRRARITERLLWDDRLARLFAADCAERVLPIFENEGSGDDRPRLAIQAGRDYANGLIDDAAQAATGAAEREWQGNRLLDYAYGRIA